MFNRYWLYIMTADEGGTNSARRHCGDSQPKQTWLTCQPLAWSTSRHVARAARPSRFLSTIATVVEQMVYSLGARIVTGKLACSGKNPTKENLPVGSTRTQSVVERRPDCEEPESNSTNNKQKVTKHMADEISSNLTTALKAAQSRLPTISSNPVGLSANLTQQAHDLSSFDYKGEINKSLDSLKEASNYYDSKRNEPNVELIEARNQVFRLRSELSKAEEHLKNIEARGTFLDQLANAVASAEGMVMGLAGSFSRLVTNQLLELRYGQIVNVGSVPKEVRRDLQLHARLTNLKKFHISRDERNDEQSLYRRAEAAYDKLEELKAHIAKDKADNAKK